MGSVACLACRCSPARGCGQDRSSRDQALTITLADPLRKTQLPATDLSARLGVPAPGQRRPIYVLVLVAGFKREGSHPNWINACRHSLPPAAPRSVQRRPSAPFFTKPWISSGSNPCASAACVHIRNSIGPARVRLWLVGRDMPDTGHHQSLVDIDELPPPNQPMGDDIQHFGKGQTQATLMPPLGEHTLLLILGDKDHIPHD